MSAGLPKRPPNVEPLVAIEVPAAVPSFGGPNKLVVVAGAASFLSSGFVASLLVVTPNNPPPLVPPREKPPVAVGPVEVSGFLAPNKPPPNPVVVVEVDAEVAALSAGFGGSPKSPPPVEVVVFVDKSPVGLGGPPNNPPGVVFVFSEPPNILLEVAGLEVSLFSAGFVIPNNPPPKAGAGVGFAAPFPEVSGFAGSLASAGLGAPNNVELVPIVPPPNVEDVVPPVVEGAGFVVFPKGFPPVPCGAGVDGFTPNKLPGVVPGAGLVEVVPPPNRPPTVAGVVAVVVPDAGVVEVVPESEVDVPPKMFDGAVVVVPVVVVPVPVVPVPVTGVVVGVGPL